MAKVNSWLLVNLGCEMLYIIDQRLMAQYIDKDKSAQGMHVNFFYSQFRPLIFFHEFKVLRDVTNALLSPNFFAYISTTFTDDIISLQQARILLTDIACCSLMRLDVHSLDKLLDLMLMIFKWQVFLMNSPDDLLSITLKHLHGIGRLMPEKAKMLLIDQTNQYFFSSWANFADEQKYSIVRKLNKFLAPQSIRISLLIRMKLQLKDGSFVDKLTASSNDFFRYYCHNIGENIYEKINHFPQCQNLDKKDHNKSINDTKEIDFLFQQFKVDLTENIVATPAATSNESEYKNTHEKKEQNEKLNSVEQHKTLDELKRKCKLDLCNNDDAPPVYEDNFQELLNMLDSNT